MPEINLNESSTEQYMSDFEKMSQQGIWLKRFHAEWCGYCQNMESEWRKFVNTHNHKDIKIVSIEDKAIQKMGERPNNILGYPSIHLYKDGLFQSEFNGERTSDNLKEFLRVHVPEQSGGRVSLRKKRKKKKSKRNQKPKKNRRNNIDVSRKKSVKNRQSSF